MNNSCSIPRQFFLSFSSNLLGILCVCTCTTYFDLIFFKYGVKDIEVVVHLCHNLLLFHLLLCGFLIRLIRIEHTFIYSDKEETLLKFKGVENMFSWVDLVQQKSYFDVLPLNVIFESSEWIDFGYKKHLTAFRGWAGYWFVSKHISKCSLRLTRLKYTVFSGHNATTYRSKNV